MEAEFQCHELADGLWFSVVKCIIPQAKASLLDATFLIYSKKMKHKKLTFKGMLSKMGNKTLVTIPKSLVDDELCSYRDKRVRITVIFEELVSH